MPRPSRKDVVLAAAERLFLDNGYAETTVRAIAARAGTTTGAIYSSFTGKADMLGHLLVSFWQETQEMLQSRLDASSGSQVRATFLAVRDFARERAEAYRLMQYATAHPKVLGEMDPAVAERIREAMGGALTLATQAVQKDQAAGRLSADEDPLVLHALFSALVNGLMFSRMSSRFDDIGVAAEAVDEAALRLFFPEG